MKLYLRIQLLACSGVAFGMTLIDYDLRVPVLWQMNSGQSVQLQYDREKETRIIYAGNTVYRLRYPEVITHAITSDNKTSLMFLIRRYKGRGAYFYDHVLVVKETTPLACSIEKALSIGSLGMTKRRWIAELGAISDDGETALVKIAKADREQAPYKCTNSWETLDLRSGQTIKVGLAIGEAR